MQSLVGDSHSRAVAPVMAGAVQRPTTCRIARIHLLGPMRATSYLGDDILPRTKKARALLACLCLASGAEVPRIQLARMLWEQAGDRAARASLRQALREVCAAIGPLAAELISRSRATIRLNADACWIDVLALRESFSLDLALLCSGQLLEGLDGVSASFDGWLARERECFDRETSGLSCPQTAPAWSDHNRAVPARPDTYARGPLPGRNRLRVAVLRFEATGQGRGTERWEGLAFSVSHDIVAALARFRWFDVVAPISFNSGPQANIASADLFNRKDLDYVVDGRISRHGQSIAIDVRLLDLTRRAQPVWSERFELQTNELHRLNEIVTGRVVGCIDPLILFIEGQPNRREHYGATGLLLMALPLLHSMEQEKLERAGELINQAMVVDPHNAMARAWTALWHIARIVQGWADDVDASLAVAESLSLQAIEIDPDNAEALGIYAHICAWRKDFEAAVRHFDRSLRLNPNLAFIWALSAATCCYIGEPVLALQRLKRSRDLAPLHPYWDFLGGIYVIAYTFKGDYERAVLVGRDIIAGNPYSRLAYRHVIAALGNLRRPDEAKPYIEKVLSAEPHFTVEHFAKTYPIKRPQDRRRYMRGLLLAGVPAR
jgi:TolB-like protein/Flp pilus assembly protein TadD